MGPMRRRGLHGALLLLACAGVAEARSVRVTKSSTPKLLHVYWVQYMSGTEAQIIAIPGNLNVGEEYDIVDSRGYVGRVRMKTADDADMGCPQYKFRRGMGAFVGAARDFSSDAVAIGPQPAKAASTAILLTPRDLSRMPKVPDQLVSRTFLDVNGDAEADVIRDYWQCLDPAKAQNGNYGYCFQTMSRSRVGSEWKVMEATQLMNCY